jgi:hypothetical protein
MSVKFQVEVFWVVTSFRVVVGYRRFRSPCSLKNQNGKLFFLIGATFYFGPNVKKSDICFRDFVPSDIPIVFME